ncbi:MAG: hypothetical protein K2O06_03980 [Acetatifactor sp.]|nr:hypothetical protein [Acetatifactor sp.]
MSDIRKSMPVEAGREVYAKMMYRLKKGHGMKSKYRLKMRIGLAAAAGLTAFLLAGIFARAEEYTYTDAGLATRSPGLPGLEEMNRVAGDEKLGLYANVKTGEVALVDVESGNVWCTNPPGAAQAESTTPLMRSRLLSQLVLSYHDTKANEFTVNSYEDCILTDQLTYRLTENGIEFRYVIGELEESIIIPRWISGERMDGLLSQMSPEDAKFVKRQYKYYALEEIREREKKQYLEEFPILEEHPIYVLRDNAAYIQEEMMVIFGELGYDRAQMEADCAENGYSSERFRPWFVIPLEYSLEEGGLTVRVDAARIQYDAEHYPLTDIAILPYFGAAGETEEGYIFVPDGSGALIDYNSGSRTTPQYQQKIYGADLSEPRRSAAEADEELTVKMPVFGAKTGQKAMFAIIEEGDALACLYANTAGKTDAWNTVYASFRYLSYGQVSLTGIMEESNKLFLYAREPYQGCYTIRYLFLEGEDASYSGMARAYRAYLMEKGVLTPRELPSRTPFYLNLLGAADMEKSFLGINYHVTRPLTTFSQAEEILEKLWAGGVEHLILTYKGWYNGGLLGTIASSLKQVDSLGSAKSRTRLLERLEEKGNRYYFAVELQRVFRDGLFDGYSPSAWAPRYFDKSAFGVMNYACSNGKVTGKAANLVKLSRMQELGDSFLEEAGRLKLGSFQVGTLSNLLYSDYSQDAQYDRQKALYVNSGLLEDFSREGLVLAGENAAAYAWKNLQDITGIPLYSNHYYIITREVPFYACVLHGSMEYAGEALNLSDDYRTAWLKSIESGAGLSFEWMYEDNSILTGTEYTQLYSVQYDVWLEEALELYNRINSELGAVNNVPIRDHYQAEENVTVTVYEDGTRVYVNYGYSDAALEGIRVPARDFTVTGGGI